MKKFFLTGLIMMSVFCTGFAQNEPKTVTGQRKFSMTIREDPDGKTLKKIDMRGVQRGIFDDIFNIYRQTAAAQFASSANSIVSIGTTFLTNAFRDKRQDWRKAVNNECRYVKQLKMQTDIVDFYKKGSVIGALDPTDLVFNGFGCQQVVEFNDNGKIIEKPVFNVYCSLRDDTVGLKRIYNHTKFEVVVDSVYFDPYLCNLPNDSLTDDVSTRIDFDFKKRTNLTFTLQATILSSWMNEATEIFKDQELGNFFVTVKIREEDLEKGVFTYSRRNPNDKKKLVSVSGESFIVPRSYVGTTDGTTSSESAYGTGQYKVNMTVSETCNINENYYKEKAQQDDKGRRKPKDKWNSEWKDEWKKIKKRQKSKPIYNEMINVAKAQWTGIDWVTTFVEPIASTYIQIGNKFIAGSNGTAATATMKQSTATQGGTAQQGMPMPTPQ